MKRFLTHAGRVITEEEVPEYEEYLRLSKMWPSGVLPSLDAVFSRSRVAARAGFDYRIRFRQKYMK